MANLTSSSTKKAKQQSSGDGKNNNSKAKAVLSKSVLKVATQLELSGKDLADILNMSPSQISKIKQRQQKLDPKSSSGQLGLILIRIYSNLAALVGSEDKQIIEWLKSKNLYFNATPLSVLKRDIEGAANVVRYLDAMRG